jgi:hypothetical protein
MLGEHLTRCPHIVWYTVGLGHVKCRLGLNAEDKNLTNATEDMKPACVTFIKSCGPSVSSPALLSFHGVQFTGFLQQWNTTPTYIVDLLGNATILQRM